MKYPNDHDAHRHPPHTALKPRTRSAHEHHRHDTANSLESQEESPSALAGVVTDAYRAPACGAEDKPLSYFAMFKRLVRFGERVLRLQRVDAEDRAQEAIRRYLVRFPCAEREVLVFTRRAVGWLKLCLRFVHCAELRCTYRRLEDLHADFDDLDLVADSDPFEALDVKRRFEGLRTWLQDLPPEAVELFLRVADLVDSPAAMTDGERQRVARMRRRLLLQHNARPSGPRRERSRRPTRR